MGTERGGSGSGLIPCCAPQERQEELCAVAATFAEPIASANYSSYISDCLRSETPDSVRALVQAAPGDFSRRFKNYHHAMNHA